MYSSENLDHIFESIQHLKYNKHEVILFHVIDKKLEIDFDFLKRPYLFVDSETNENIKLHSSLVADDYKKLVNNFKEEIKLKCAQIKVDFMEAYIENNFDQVLLKFLQKREKIK